MSIANLRTKIVTALNTISASSSFKVYPFVPTAPQENTFIYVHYDDVNQVVSYSHTLSKMNFVITICTIMTGTIEEAQARLDPFVDDTGTSSIRAATVAHLTPYDLTPDGSHSHLVRGFNFAKYNFNGTYYYGAKFNLEITTN